jgi:hypothetical protein
METPLPKGLWEKAIGMEAPTVSVGKVIGMLTT